MAHASIGGGNPAIRTALKPTRNKTALLKSLLWMGQQPAWPPMPKPS